MSTASSALTEVLFSFELGGSERLGADLARHMFDRGIRTSVCSTHGSLGPIAKSLEASGIECEALHDGPIGRLGRPFRLLRHLRRNRTSVLHVHHFNMLSVVYNVARFAGVERIVVTEHSDHQVRKKGRTVRAASRLGRKVDLITAVHQNLAEYLSGVIPAPREPIRVIPNAVDTDRFSPAGARAEGLRAPESFVVGLIGRLHPDKDPLNLLNAVNLSRQFRPELHVWIVGEGEMRAAMEEYVATHGLAERVRFLGLRDDIPELMRAMDAYVLSSVTEGLPMALLEAMSSGLPVVATRVGGVPAALGDSGVLVPPENPEELASALDELRADAERCRRLGRLARARAVKEFDASAMYRRYGEAFFPDDWPIEDTAKGTG